VEAEQRRVEAELRVYLGSQSADRAAGGGFPLSGDALPRVFFVEKIEKII
jgi:hypothetical protein